MLRIRRLYFYLVLYASLSMLLVGVATVLRVLIERLFDIASSGFFGMFVGQAQMQEQTALGTALVLVGLPVWLLHWRVVQGWLGAPGGVDDRRSALRRLYVYGVLFTTALSALIAGRDLIENLLALAIGPTAGSVRPSDVTGPLPFAVVATVFWAYHWRIAAVDRNVAGEEDASATLRRWYLYAMLSIGVVLVMRNLAWLCQQIWQTLLQPATLTSVGQTTLSRALVSSGAGLLVGLVVMVGHRAWSQSILAVPNWHGEDERRSVLRKLYLYAMVLLTVATALTNASEILRFAIASLLGVAPSAVQGTPVVVALGEPLANTLVFGAFWIFYWRSVGLAAASQPEVGQQAGVRRLYFYLVSAIALAFVGVSVASLLRLSTDVILQQSAIDLSAMRGELARNVSWLLIGLPVWLWHWARTQALAGGPRGLEETRATTRRWYLYLVALVGVAVLLVSGARVVFEFVLMALGRAPNSELIANLSHAMTDAVVAGLVVWYHWFLVLRADLAALRAIAGARQAVAVIAGLDASAVERLQQFARTSLDGSRTRVYWTDQVHARETLTEALGKPPDQ